MADEGFLRRWARLKATPEQAAAASPSPAPAVASVPVPVTVALDSLTPLAGEGTLAAAEVPLPTIAEAAALTADSDFSAFVAKNVDAAVRRLAMKKLFADPHFQGHDGLDIYMGDYNLPSPVSADMLADMTHNKNIFAKLDEVIEQVDGMLGAPPTSVVPAGDGGPGADSDDSAPGQDSADAEPAVAADGPVEETPALLAGTPAAASPMDGAHGTPSIKTPEPATLPAPDQDIA